MEIFITDSFELHALICCVSYQDKLNWNKQCCVMNAVSWDSVLTTGYMHAIKCNSLSVNCDYTHVQNASYAHKCMCWITPPKQWSVEYLLQTEMLLNYNYTWWKQRKHQRGSDSHQLHLPVCSSLPLHTLC